MKESVSERLIVALDVPEVPDARELIAELIEFNVRFKIGPELFLKAGPDWVKKLVRQGTEFFLDLKFHDIPNTVEAACRQAAELGVWMMNVHALGGAEMIRRARVGMEDGAAKAGHDKPLLIAVTVLTSHDETTLKSIGLEGSPMDAVVRLSRLAKDAGADGVVASALEASAIREACGGDFLIVTPGIRPSGGATHDQARISTPAGAIKAGATHLVVGRPIREAERPSSEARVILNEMERALG